jgi:hypothetical protein
MLQVNTSNYLVHWVSGSDDNAGFESLFSIVTDKTIYGGHEKIRGGYVCCCFSECSKKDLEAGDFFKNKKYKPFGVGITIEYLNRQGGRKVIYQPESDFPLLPDSLKWRHVRHEPAESPIIDFTWEKEWRVKTLEFPLPDDEVVLLVPDKSWIAALNERYYSEEWHRYHSECVGYGEDVARPPQVLKYKMVPLSKLS